MSFDKYIDPKFEYDVYVQSVYDGDTVTVDIKLGFDVVLSKQKIRLFGVNTPEMRGEDKENGKKVRDYVRSKILNKHIKMNSLKDKTGKYGRFLGILHYTEDDKTICLNQELLDKEMAVEFML